MTVGYAEVPSAWVLMQSDPTAPRSAPLSVTPAVERQEIALEDLPPRLRSVIVLRDIYDLPHEAIASELGITESAAKVRLHRARRKLREQLFPLPGEEDARAM